MREREIEKAFSIKAKKAGGLAIKFISPAFDGMPDRLVLMPAARWLLLSLKHLERSLELFSLYGTGLFLLWALGSL